MCPPRGEELRGFEVPLLVGEIRPETCQAAEQCTEAGREDDMQRFGRGEFFWGRMTAMAFCFAEIGDAVVVLQEGDFAVGSAAMVFSGPRHV